MWWWIGSRLDWGLLPKRRRRLGVFVVVVLGLIGIGLAWTGVTIVQSGLRELVGHWDILLMPVGVVWLVGKLAAACWAFVLSVWALAAGTRLIKLRGN